MKQRKRGITGSTLKMIAVVTMLIDHIGAVILERILVVQGMENETLLSAYWCMRMIGRISFPIFCFLLVEGFMHTSDIRKYVGRLAIFSLLSEVPFDLAIKGIPFYMEKQNVFLTLLLGALVLLGFRWAETRGKVSNIIKYMIQAVVLLLGMGAAYLLRTDYAAFGIAAIAILYLCRKYKSVQIAAGSIYFLQERTAPFAFIPIALYNGERGWNLKYLFYIFYPLHLLVLYFITLVMGLPSM